MKVFAKVGAFFFFLSFLSILSYSQEAQWRQCIEVVDGDTIRLDQNETLRLIGIDAPETQDPRKTVQYFGKESSDFVKRLVEGKRVRLEYDQTRTDKYGRTLAYVYLEDGTFLNSEIIKQGYGLAYIKYPFKYLEEFLLIEREARTTAVGLWASPEPIKKAAPTIAPLMSQLKQTATKKSNITVYLTKSGSKYHRSGCRSLRKSAIPVNLQDAIDRGYGPCGTCRPPTSADN